MEADGTPENKKEQTLQGRRRAEIIKRESASSIACEAVPGRRDGGKPRRSGRREGRRKGGMAAWGTQEVGPSVDLSVHTETAPETSINIVFFCLFFL